MVKDKMRIAPATEYERKPVCKSAQEIYWERNIENLSLEVYKKTTKKLGTLNILQSINLS